MCACPEAQLEAAGGRCHEREAYICEQQSFEAVTVRHGQGEDDRKRDHRADDHCPEQPLFGVEARAPVAVGDRQAEDHRSRQPADDEEFDEYQARGSDEVRFLMGRENLLVS